MSVSVFVLDQNGTPMMPMAAAYARRLLKQHKAKHVPHHAFTIVQLTRVVLEPVTRPLAMVVSIGLNTAELTVVVRTRHDQRVVLRVLIDLRTDIAWRMRRRAGHRRRRKSRLRYRTPQRYGRPFKLQRPSLAQSAWAKQHWPKRKMKSKRRWYNAVVRWRVQAIERVISTLRSWLPLSEIAVIPDRFVEPNFGQTPYLKGKLARCAYCGTQDGGLVIDHILPQSRGGSDAITNLVLACQPCNTTKGNRTPEEAAMPIQYGAVPVPYKLEQAGPYIIQTKALLCTKLHSYQMSVIDDVEAGLFLLSSVDSGQIGQAPSYIAKPIARPNKQRFTSRNYPITTILQNHFVRRKHVVKRRTRVNAGILLCGTGKQPSISVLRVGDRADAGVQVVRLGMLCRGERAGKAITGIVAAIHSSGRVTLLHPAGNEGQRIQWMRTVTSSRQAFRIISTDRVIFFALPRSTSASSDDRS